MASATLKALGQFVLTCSGQTLPRPPTKKARALIAYLVMHRTGDAARERLLEIFWRDFDPQRGRENLNATLWSIRRLFRKSGLNPDDFLRANHMVVRWHAMADFDADRLLELSARTDERAADEALSLYRGDFLEGDFEDWAVGERERLALAYETLLSRATNSFGSVAAAEQLIGRNPYDETAYATLIDSQLSAGQTIAAAILVERCRRALDEVGAKPSDRFEEMFGKLRRPRDDPQSELRLPFVARDAELRALGERLHQREAGIGSVTIVHGDAGIGKSTLLAHAARMAAEGGGQTIEIHCSKNEPAGLGDAAKSIATADLGAVALIDDVQNLTTDRLTLFTDLVNRHATRHCFIVATRPEALAGLRLHLELSSPFELELGPLSRADMEGALRQAAGSDLPEVSAKLFERTGGHPFYVARLLESLIEEGGLERRRRAWSVTQKFDGSLPLPGTVRAFVETRLTARGNVAATVAGALALEPFATATDLGSVLSLQEEPLLDALDDLLSLGLIKQPPTGPQFEFLHDLVREVAAARLNAGRAARIHRRYTELLQSDPGRDAPARIAMHSLAAGDVLVAGHAFARVARGALESGRFHDCFGVCAQGVSACETLERSGERDELLATLYRTLASAHFALGHARLAVQAAEQGVRFARAADSAANLATALMVRAQCSDWAHHGTAAASDWDEAATIARRLENSALLAASLTGLSSAARLRCDKESALRYAQEAYDRAVLAGDWPLAQSAVAESLLVCCSWWDTTNARQLAATSLELAQRCSETQHAHHYNLASLLSYVLGRYADAKRDLAKAFEIGEHASPPAAFFNRLLYAMVALAEARWDDALELAADLEMQLGSERLPAQRLTVTALRVEALLSRDAPGDAANAAAALTAADDLGDTIFPWNVRPEVTYAQIAVARGGGAPERALRKALDATEGRAHRIPFDADLAFARIELACRAAGNDVMTARAALRRAYYEMLRRAGSPSSNATPRTSS